MPPMLIRQRRKQRTIFDGVVKSQKTQIIVIPAKAGMTTFYETIIFVLWLQR